jgi:hypothetical protein
LENEELKKTLKSKEEKIEELEKEIRILKCLSPEEESDKEEEDNELWKVKRLYYRDKFIEEEEIVDDKELEILVSAVPIIRQNSGPYPEFKSLFSFIKKKVP